MDTWASFYLNLRGGSCLSLVSSVPGMKRVSEFKNFWSAAMEMNKTSTWTAWLPVSHQRRSVSVAIKKVILKNSFILMDRVCLRIIQIFQRFNEVIWSHADIDQSSVIRVRVRKAPATEQRVPGYSAVEHGTWCISIHRGFNNTFQITTLIDI